MSVIRAHANFSLCLMMLVKRVLEDSFWECVKHVVGTSKKTRKQQLFSSCFLKCSLLCNCV